MLQLQKWRDTSKVASKRCGNLCESYKVTSEL